MKHIDTSTNLRLLIPSVTVIDKVTNCKHKPASSIPQSRAAFVKGEKQRYRKNGTKANSQRPANIKMVPIMTAIAVTTTRPTNYRLRIILNQ